MIVSLVFPECFVRVRQCFLNVSFVSRACFVSVPLMFRDCFVSVSLVFRECFVSVSCACVFVGLRVRVE